MFEAYQIAVKLKLNDAITPGLALITSHMRSLQKDAHAAQASVGELERRLQGIKQLGLVGGAMAGVGFLGLMGLRAPLEEASKLDQQIRKFSLYGLGDAINREAVNYAKGMNIIGTSTVEAMRLVNEAQGVFRESGLSGSAALDGAKLAAPMLAKIGFATASLDETTQARMRTSGLAMLRFIEMRGGLQGADRFNEIGDAGWKAIQTSGGNVNWEALRQFMARGGVAAQGLSNTALFGKLEPIIGEMKGSTAGTALMTAYNRLVGGVKVPNQIAHLLAENGIWDSSKIVWNALGGIKQFTGNPLRDMALLTRDPTEFYDKDIMPMYQRMQLSPEERARENTMIFGRTGGALFTLYDRQREVAQRSVESQRKALGIDASVAAARGGLPGSELDLHAKWRSVLAELGTAILPLAIKGVQGLSSMLKGATDLAREFPNLTKGLVLTGATLFGMAAAGGSLMLFRAGLQGIGLALNVLTLGAGGGALTQAASGLLALGGALPGILSKLGAAGLLGFVGYGSYKIAGALGAGKLGTSLGDMAYDWLHPTEKMFLSPGETGMYGSKGKTTTINLKVDGRTLSTVVADQWGREVRRPQTGTSTFDGRMALTPAGSN